MRSLAVAGTGKIGIVVRGDEAARRRGDVPPRLRPVFDALAARGIAAEPVVFHEGAAREVRDQIAHLDGTLVWVDPIDDGRDRTTLDAILRDASRSGAWVSAHPDVIMKMGTKDVLVQTTSVGWCHDAHAYATHDALRAEFPARLAASGARVLKQHRGNAGMGVWKVELAEAASSRDPVVRVQHAHPRDLTLREMPLSEFMEFCARYFEGGGHMIDQPFEPRIAEGLVRCYLVRDAVAGFSTQAAAGAVAAPAGELAGDVFGLPSPKTMYPPDEPRFAALRSRLESDWLPAMQRRLDVEDDALPLLWDADFMYGERTAAGEDTYVLCEINVSCVIPFPASVPPALAAAVAARLAGPRA